MKSLSCAALCFSSCFAVPSHEKSAKGGLLDPFYDWLPHQHQLVSWELESSSGSMEHSVIMEDDVGPSHQDNPAHESPLKNHSQAYWQARDKLTLCFEKLTIFFLFGFLFIFFSLGRVLPFVSLESFNVLVFNLPILLAVYFCIMFFLFN